MYATMQARQMRQVQRGRLKEPRSGWTAEGREGVREMKRLMVWLAFATLCIGATCFQNCYPTWGGGYSCTMTYVSGDQSN